MYFEPLNLITSNLIRRHWCIVTRQTDVWLLSRSESQGLGLNPQGMFHHQVSSEQPNLLWPFLACWLADCSLKKVVFFIVCPKVGVLVHYYRVMRTKKEEAKHGMPVNH